MKDSKMGLDMYLYGRNKKQRNDQPLAYWRKANMIHNWFVENVQNGKDDQEFYTVTIEQIHQLLATCKNVIKKRLSSYSKKTLPTIDGFFFGDTNYNESYYEDIKDTILQLNKILSSCKNNDSFCYHSWW